ncbi:alpha-L-rhamnosidase C-terminal domain-containing protein [Yinghuangia aomiensis]|uniref:alpha-L-rhamnosidase C-terminal domain-containing protein n=1 Tax=Yinghuangia aomiensis TaxID=676205 RepID=UPI0031ECF070
MAGIPPPAEPGPDSAGYRRFTIEPRPGGGLTSAEAQFVSPYGTIASAWRLAEGRFVLDARSPRGRKPTSAFRTGAQAGRRAREPHLPMSLPRPRAASAARGREGPEASHRRRRAPKAVSPAATSGRAGP